MTPKNGSPEWWRDRLLTQLEKRSKKVLELERYYDGDHPLPQPPPEATKGVVGEAQKALEYLLEMSITNFLGMVADAPAERMRVTGFRLGDDTASDKDAWRIWQENSLDADSPLVIGTALQVGNAAMLVWPRQGGGVDITPEHPSEVIVAYQPGSLRRRAAALKRWTDDDGYGHVTLYLPKFVYKWISTRAQLPGTESLIVTGATGSGRWRERNVKGETWPLKNPFDQVSMVELRANRRLRPAPFGGGVSEFASVIPIQNRINKTIFDRLTTAEAQAFRQRVIAGWDPLDGVDPDDKAALAEAAQTARIRMGASLAWTFEDKDTKVTELGQADFSPFNTTTETDIRFMASITKTPEWSLLRGMANPPSADALRASLADLIAKTRTHTDNFGEDLEEVVRLGLHGAGKSEAARKATQAETMWADMETRTLGEAVNAAVQMKALEVPRRALWEQLPDVTDQELNRWEAMRTQDQFQAALFGTDEPNPAGPPTDDPDADPDA